MKKFLIAVSLKGEDGKMNGKRGSNLVDMASLEKGKFKELSRTTIHEVRPGGPYIQTVFQQ